MTAYVEIVFDNSDRRIDVSSLSMFSSHSNRCQFPIHVFIPLHSKLLEILCFHLKAGRRADNNTMPSVSRAKRKRSA